MNSDQTPEKKRLRLLPAFVVMYCVLQPLLDVLGYWQQILELSNLPTLAVRSLLLTALVLLGFLLSNRKRYYLLMAAVLAALSALHVWANLPAGYPEPMSDVSNLIRLYTLPLSTLCFLTFLKRDGERVFRAMKKGMALDLLIILAVELLSVLTGTDRGTYVKEQIGVIGWFVWGNCQSAILSMLTPLVICWTLKRWPGRLLPAALVTLGAETALYFFGARLSFATLAASGIGVSVCLLWTDRRAWKQAITIFLITALFLGAYPLSPAARRLQSLEQTNQSREQEMQNLLESMPAQTQTAPPSADGSVSAAPVQTEPSSQASSGTDPLSPELKELEAVYFSYFSSVVDRFGIERVAEKYNYTQDPEILGNIRICKRIVCEMVMEDAPVLCRFFGLPVSTLRVPIYGVPDEQSNYLVFQEYVSFEVENDFIGIYYVLGAVGLVLLAIFLLFFLLRALVRLLQNWKQYFTLDLAAFAMAYGFAMIHAWCTTSVLRRNNASVYLALVLAGIWYLTRKDPEKAVVSPDEREAAPPERSSYGSE